MKSGNIYFSGMICYLNDLKLSINEFKDTIEDKTISEEKGNSVQIFNLKYIDNFLTINFSDGSSMPRNPKIYDQHTHTLEENPRNKNQIEPKDYFAIIDFNTSFLWLNNTKKKTLLLNFLQSYFKNKSIVLKDIYDEQDFINCLKTLDGIKISAVPDNIFAQTNTTSQALNDEMYLASKAELSLTYDKIQVIDKIKDKISNILGNRESFQNITISGRDEKDLGMIFNNNLFTRKISFKSEVDENGMFTPNDIFEKLINEITNELKYEKN
jgi:hypothetical protein